MTIALGAGTKPLRTRATMRSAFVNSRQELNLNCQDRDMPLILTIVEWCSSESGVQRAYRSVRRARARKQKP